MSTEIKPDMTDRIKVSAKAYGPEALRSTKRNWRLIVGGAAAVVLAVAAIAMAVGWLVGDSDDVAQTQAEAPLIKADAEPDKVRPEDPGGMEVANRDMLVYRRLDGGDGKPPVERLLPNPEQPVVPPRPVAAPGREIEPGQIETVEIETDELVAEDAEDAPGDEELDAENLSLPAQESPERSVTPEPQQAPPVAPKPVAPTKLEPTPVPKKPAAPAPSRAAAPAAGAYQIQLVAVRSRQQAEVSWAKLSKEYADVLGGLKPNIVRADLGAKGVLYRLRAGPAGDESAARAICASLAKRKKDCLVVPPGG